MKKQKIICKTLQIVVCVACFITFAIFVWSFFNKTLLEDNSVVIFAILAVMYGGLSLWDDYIKEKENPLSYCKIKSTIKYAVKCNHGSKSDFVKEHGEEMYNHFLKKGFIKETVRKNRQLWQLTIIGVQFFNQVTGKY